MAIAKCKTETPRGRWQDEDDPALQRASDAEWEQYLRLPHCIALGEPSGKLIPGSRLTDDMTLRECADVLKTLKVQHPAAGIYLASQVNARSA